MKYRGELVVNGVTTPIIGMVNNQTTKIVGQNFKGTRPNQIVREIISRASIDLREVSHHAVFVINEDGEVWQYVGQMNVNRQSVGNIRRLNAVLPKAYVEEAMSGITPIIKLLRG